MNLTSLLSQLKAYKKKYYTDRLLKGAFLSLLLLLAMYLIINTLEYYGQFSTTGRAVLFYSFLAVLAYLVVSRIAVPLYHLATLDKSLSDEEAARQLGQFFPEVKDRLLNTLQLSKNSNGTSNALLEATIAQRTEQLSAYKFTQAVNLKEAYKRGGYAVGFGFLLFMGFIFVPQFFTESTNRLIRHTEEFVPQAPFSFELINNQKEVFYNEDYKIKLKLDGDAIPAQAYVIGEGGRRIRMAAGDKAGEFVYTFTNVQQKLDFAFEAAGFNSKNYKVDLQYRPMLTGFQVSLNYPNYTGRQDEMVENTGNLTVPAGTTIEWKFTGLYTDQLQLATATDTVQATQDNKNFTVKKQFLRSTPYAVQLRNQHASQASDIKYQVDVIADQYPKITLQQHQDTVLFDYLLLGGTISDDYGLSRLNLFYKINEAKADAQSNDTDWKRQPLTFNRSQSSQSYYHEWNIKEIKLKPGQSLEYYVEVADNDGINGPKASRSSKLTLAVPEKEEVKQKMSQAAAQTKSQMEEAMKKSESLKDQSEELRKKLLAKKQLDWKDKEAIKELMKQQKELEKAVEKMKEQNEKANEMKDRFSPPNKDLQQKIEQLQKLMEDILNPEMKKLYDELEKLLDEKVQPEQLQQMLEEQEKNDEDLAKEIERALELFKQLQLEQKLEENIEELEELAKEQEELAKETEKADEKKADLNKQEKEQKQQELEKKQEELNKKFDELKKDVDEAEKMNEEMESPQEMDDTDKMEEEISEDQQESSQQLQKQKNQKASESQQGASDKMKKMAQKMKERLQEMQSEQAQEDAEDLRAISENLLTLSFNQEELMKDFRNINQSDPRFVELGQQQLKLRDDAKIIEDSLRALAKRVFQIESFVTREVGDMNDYMEDGIKYIRESRPHIAAGKQQQAMTSMNNLALMLNETLDNMQQQMAAGMQGGAGKPQKKPGQDQQGQGKGGKPSLGQMQQQLSNQISNLKKSGMSGRALSEQLAKLAAQQEAIRRQMQEMSKGGKGKGGKGSGQGGEGQREGGQQPGGKEKGGKDGEGDGGKEGSGGNLSELIKQMEQNEEDLVNKRLTQELINRQQQITTRMLEAEKSMREQKMDEERKGETAQPRKNEKFRPISSSIFKRKTRLLSP